MIILVLYYILYLGHKQRLVVKQKVTHNDTMSFSYREISLYYLRHSALKTSTSLLLSTRHRAFKI